MHYFTYVLSPLFFIFFLYTLFFCKKGDCNQIVQSPLYKKFLFYLFMTMSYLHLSPIQVYVQTY